VKDVLAAPSLQQSNRYKKGTGQPASEYEIKSSKLFWETSIAKYSRISTLLTLTDSINFKMLPQILIGLLSFALPAIAGWDELYNNCTAVSFDYLEAIGTHSRFYLGTKGIYGQNTQGACIYMDTSADSIFAKDKPELYAEFLESLQNNNINLNHFDFIDRPNKRDPAEKLGARSCANICDGSNVSRVACSDISCTRCTLYYNQCINLVCYYYSICT
jgi:hypothetical protein